MIVRIPDAIDNCAAVYTIESCIVPFESFSYLLPLVLPVFVIHKKSLTVRVSYPLTLDKSYVLTVEYCPNKVGLALKGIHVSAPF